MKHIPTDKDWGDNKYGLDEKYAYRNFSGKNHDEAINLFIENSMIYQEDLIYMYGYVFDYYLNSFLDFLISADANEDSDAASCFLALIMSKIEYNYADIVPSKKYIELVLDIVSNYQLTKYDASEDIYGSFKDRSKIIKKYLYSYPKLSIDEISTSIVKDKKDLKRKEKNKRCGL